MKQKYTLNLTEDELINCIEVLQCQASNYKSLFTATEDSDYMDKHDELLELSNKFYKEWTKPL